MTAKEMFEKLGYKLAQWYMDEYPECIRYEFQGNNVTQYKTIYFWNDLKLLSINNDINLQEFKAIQQQIKELGWND